MIEAVKVTDSKSFQTVLGMAWEVLCDCNHVGVQTKVGDFLLSLEINPSYDFMFFLRSELANAERQLERWHPEMPEHKAIGYMIALMNYELGQ